MTVDHYDLFARPDCKAVSVLIVSPYVESEFFQEVARRLRPERMTVVIDDGCRPEDVDMVRKSAPATPEVQVALGSARGLAHLEVFYVMWQTANGEVARTIVWGSGNATHQAFRGDINAELMCRAQLTSSSDPSILNWIKEVATKAAKVKFGDQTVREVRDAELAAGVHVRLPSMMIRSAESKATTFDRWLQRGRIVASYRPDPGFLRVSVDLLSDIPRGETEKRIAKLVETPSRRYIGVRYLNSIGPPEGPEQDRGKRWRAPFCVWTAYGEWCSHACYQEKADRFRAARHEERDRNLVNLGTLHGDPARQKAREDYLGTLRGLCDASGRKQAGRYLHCLRDGRPKEEHYSNLFENCLSRDLALCADTEFRRQYVDGCEVSDVPRFRTDTTAWESFVQSFSRNLCKEARKPSRALETREPQSRLLRRLRWAIGADGFSSPTGLTEILRNRWERPLNGSGMTLGECIDGYQNDGERIPAKSLN